MSDMFGRMVTRNHMRMLREMASESIAGCRHG
jgi:hypothetical protein